MKYILVFLILFSASSYACKSRISGKDYPINELLSFEEVLVVEVLATKQNEEFRYIKTESANIKVLQGLKGNIRGNQKIVIKHASESANAICPVFLETGHMYLLPLKKVGNEYFYSRYSLIVSNANNPKFSKFVEQVKNNVK